MAKIHVLSSETIDKIAAGEVVERPNSVVKELVENAMDAGATSITVEIKEGGISFIRITDNGTGIEKSEIRNAFLRHATSKIETAEDLSNIVFTLPEQAKIAFLSKITEKINDVQSKNSVGKLYTRDDQLYKFEHDKEYKKGAAVFLSKVKEFLENNLWSIK